MKLLLVSLYFPPAGGAGVQRPLKFATHLPGLGIETHVLAPDDPKWVHADPDLPLPTQAWVHRARYLGPKGRKPAEELHGTEGLARIATQGRLALRRALVPDENVTWNVTAIPAAIRIARREGIDVVLTTSPPSSVHLVGAAVKRATGARWIADLRDSLVAHPAPPRRERARPDEGAGRGAGGEARRAAGGRDRLRRRRDRGGDARLRAPRPRAHDRERIRLRRLRRPRAPRVRPLPDHAHRLVLRQALAAAVPRGAGALGARGRRRALRRRLPRARTASGRRSSGSATGSS